MDLSIILYARTKIMNVLNEYNQVYYGSAIYGRHIGEPDMVISYLDELSRLILIDDLWHCFYDESNEKAMGLRPDVEQFQEIVSAYQGKIKKYNFPDYSTEDIKGLLLALEPAYKKPPRQDYQITLQKSPDWYLNGDISQGEFQILPEIYVDPADPRLKRCPAASRFLHDFTQYVVEELKKKNE